MILVGMSILNLQIRDVMTLGLTQPQQSKTETSQQLSTSQSFTYFHFTPYLFLVLISTPLYCQVPQESIHRSFEGATMTIDFLACL